MLHWSATLQLKLTNLLACKPTRAGTKVQVHYKKTGELKRNGDPESRLHVEAHGTDEKLDLLYRALVKGWEANWFGKPTTVKIGSAGECRQEESPSGQLQPPLGTRARGTPKAPRPGRARSPPDV